MCQELLSRVEVGFGRPVVLAKLQTAGHFVNWQVVIWPKPQSLSSSWKISTDLMFFVVAFHHLTIMFMVSIKVWDIVIAIASQQIQFLLVGNWTLISSVVTLWQLRPQSRCYITEWGDFQRLRALSTARPCWRGFGKCSRDIPEIQCWFYGPTCPEP